MASNSAATDEHANAADAARARIGDTIDEIQDRLNPRRILGDAVEKVQGSGKDLIGKAGGMARAHPLALGAAAAAIGLALFARSRLSNARVDLGDGTTDYTDYDDGAAAPPTALYDEYDDYDSPAPVESEAGQTSPLVSILIGLAAGAALGALLPETEAERRVLGDTGNRLGAAARAAMRRAGDELDAHGLSVDTVRERASASTRKARDAARSVVDAARDELKG